MPTVVPHLDEGEIAKRHISGKREVHLWPAKRRCVFVSLSISQGSSRIERYVMAPDFPLNNSQPRRKSRKKEPFKRQTPSLSLSEMARLVCPLMTPGPSHGSTKKIETPPVPGESGMWGPRHRERPTCHASNRTARPS